MKLAVVTTHPIQYYAPLFKKLAEKPGLSLRVFYTWGEHALAEKHDPGFGKTIKWDIPLLDGYDYELVANTAKQPGSSHFRGIVNPDLNRSIANWGADALLVFGWSYHSHLQAMRHFKGSIPVYFRGDSHLLDEQTPLKKILRKGFLSWVYRYVDTAFYVGTNNKLYYLQHGLKEVQLTWAPHAIDNQRFTDPNGQYAREAAEWKQAMGIPTEVTTVLFAGKFENKKNPSILLEAAKQTSPEKYHWIFAGNGHLENELKESAQGLTNIHFIPFQNQSKMPVLYRMADLFVLPSRGPGETWGLAVNEAMACGCAVVVSNKVGCAIDLVKHGENGFRLDFSSAEDFLKVLPEKAAIEQMKAKSQEIISDWSLDITASKIYEAIAHKNQLA